MTLAAPTPVAAQVLCTQPASPAPIDDTQADAIICINVDARTNAAGDAIQLDTTGVGSYIYLDNSGLLTASDDGIDTYTVDDDSPITIINSGDIDAGDDGITADTDDDDSEITITNYNAIDAGDDGIVARTVGEMSGVTIDNFGDIDAGEQGIEADTQGDNSAIEITNEGAIDAGYDGIFAYTGGADSEITILNRGDITAEYYAILAAAYDGPITVTNYGDLSATNYDGIYATTYSDGRTVSINNYGAVNAGLHGLHGATLGDGSTITITNEGEINSYAEGILAYTDGANSTITITNRGAITSTDDDGIDATTYGNDADIVINNYGMITSDDEGIEADTNNYYSTIVINNYAAITSLTDEGIDAETRGLDGDITICNAGQITAALDGIEATAFYYDDSSVEITNTGPITAGDNGIYGQSYGASSPVTIVNSGEIIAGDDGLDGTTSGDDSDVTITNFAAIDAGEDAIDGETYGADSDITIRNYGPLTAMDDGIDALTTDDDSSVTITNTGPIVAGENGIQAYTYGTDSPITITNSGDVFGSDAGIEADTGDPTSPITIMNSGRISAGSQLAIDATSDGGYSTILNTGVIEGFVDLTDGGDLFHNMAGGLFDARLTSDFGGDSDEFRNMGTVRTAETPGASETTSFVGLETFNNTGLITLVDNGVPGDIFSIDGDFNAGSGFLAVDAFLDGPGSPADLFMIGGNVTGITDVIVNNTSNTGGAPNQVGIPIVQVAGSVNANAFQLQNGPIDAGFFIYDLFFEPAVGNNIFELRSSIGPGGFLLPQLVTATQDIWHQTADSWFSRTADLRAYLQAGGISPGFGGAPSFLGLGAPATSPGATGAGHFTPGVWARGSAERLERDGSAATPAFGQFDLGRDLEVRDLQAGVDGGVRGVLQPGDALVVGVMGGVIFADLDYDSLTRNFDYEGGQVGAYATYLTGSLFVDALFKADILDVETQTPGFPASFDTTTYGVRVDAGYRFGSGALFAEPLATISAAFADVDGFTVGANTVAFDDETSVRGRLGLRLGTTITPWAGARLEPYVIGSVWNEFGDDPSASLTSAGTLFNFSGDAGETWGEVSAGLNLFSFDTGSSAFAKVDVTLGDDIEGVGGQAGFRVKW